jgi:ABC-type molybdate transport system permease subunit
VGVALVLLPGLIGSALSVAYAMTPSGDFHGVWDWPFLLSFVLPPVVAGLLTMLAKDLGEETATA